MEAKLPDPPPPLPGPNPGRPTLRTICSYVVGIGLIIYESVLGGGDSYALYGAALVLVAPPAFRGFEKYLDRMPGA